MCSTDPSQALEFLVLQWDDDSIASPFTMSDGDYESMFDNAVSLKALAFQGNGLYAPFLKRTAALAQRH